MEIMRSVTQRLAGPLLDRAPRRLAARPRPGRRSLRPMAEGLEVRSLLSVGLDPSFGFGGTALINLTSTATSQVSFSPSNISLQNGQVVAVGTESTSSSTSSTSIPVVVRLNTDGSIDTTFGSNGVETIPTSVVSAGVTYTLNTDDPSDIAVQSNGQIVVLGTATSTSSSVSDFVVARLNANGSIDTSFGTSGEELIPFSSSSSTPLSATAEALSIGPDGKIVAVGSVSSSTVDEFAIARLNTNGTLDTSFDTTGTATVPFTIGSSSANAVPVGVVVQSNLAIVVVGNVTPTTSSTNPVSNIAVARLNVNGTLDTSFNSTGTLVLPSYTGNNDDVASAVTLEGTQIVIAGTSTVQFASSSANFSSITDLTVTRLNSDGSFDTSFNGTGKYILSLSEGGIAYSTNAADITVMPDGSLLAGGSATQDFNFGVTGILVNLTTSGSLNPSYGSNGVALLPESPTGRLLVQADGKVVFSTGSSIARTTAPVPLVVSETLVTTGTGKKAGVSGVTIQFNTSVNPTLASNKAYYQVRVGTKGKKFFKIKSVTYNASTRSVTILFSKSAKLNKAGYQVLIAGSGIVEASGELLNNGGVLPVFVSATTTSSARSARS
jgi:uncharacterized delta-60 repeat protein